MKMGTDTYSDLKRVRLFLAFFNYYYFIFWCFACFVVVFLSGRVVLIFFSFLFFRGTIL